MSKDSSSETRWLRSSRVNTMASKVTLGDIMRKLVSIESSASENTKRLTTIELFMTNLKVSVDNFDSRLNGIEEMTGEIKNSNIEHEKRLCSLESENIKLSERVELLENDHRLYRVIIYNLHKVPGFEYANRKFLGDQIENFLIDKCCVPLNTGFVDYAVCLGKFDDKSGPILMKRSVYLQGDYLVCRY